MRNCLCSVMAMGARVGWIVGMAVICGFAPVTQAANYYFDTNGTDPGFGSADGSTGSALWTTNASGESTTVAQSFATGDYVYYGTASLGYSGTVTVNHAHKVTGIVIGEASGAITFSGGTFEPTGTAFNRVENRSDANIAISTKIQGNTAGVTQNGSGVLTLSNNSNSFGSQASTTLGLVRINNGVISVTSVANAGTASALGQGLTANYPEKLQFNGGTLRYTGGGHRTDRNFQINAGGATIDASGSGALIWSGTASYNTTTANRALTFGGSNTGTNTFSGALVNVSSSNTLSVTKSDAGRWILSGTSTYTGKTTLNGGTLGFGATTNTVGTLVVSSNSTIALGSGSVRFANSSAETWTGNLTLTNTLGATTLRFGTNQTGLASAQVAKINWNGKAVKLDDAGYVFLAPPAGTVLIIR
jgi:fibronectin-binding autotransporter adhesin